MLYRLRDIVLSALLLIFLSWLMLIIMLILKLSQERVFFRQVRTGYRTQPFRMVKFSTLRDIRPGEREEDNQRYRLTPAGKVLRRLSLDELPQLWHVLTGKMSLVGPRPLIHDYLPLYSKEDLKRFDVRPGITGWAQVKGRNSLRFLERFALDRWYVEHQSLALDFKIMLLTAGKLFRSKDVYANQQTTMPRFDGTN